MVQKGSKLEVLEMNDISISKTNPRKSIDEKSLKELSESIKQKGVLQPILVRTTKIENSFELVCGERRFRASKLAKLKTIPAHIRELTDEEAFELQIIENLERKDVHPLDEADAFKRMLDSGKYTLEDISAKMVKSEKFIVQRLKLNDLIEELREDFFNGHMGVGHALLLSRCSPDDQLEHQRKSRDHWNGSKEEPHYGTVKELREEIEDESLELDEAPFDLHDDTLIENVSPCSKCMKRTINSPLLFDDMQGKDHCMDSICFNNKVQAHTEREVAKIVNEGKNVLILSNYYQSDVPEMVANICNEFKVPILVSHSDFSTFERNLWTKEKGFWVSGSDQGKYDTVFINPSKNESGTSPETTEEYEINNQISKINDRLKRGLELDNEKIEASLRNRLDEMESNNFINELTVCNSMIERAAFIIALVEKMPWSHNDWIYEEIGLNDLDRWNKNKLWQKLSEVATEKLLNKTIRKFILSVLTDRQVADRRSYGLSEAFYQLFNLYHPDDLKIIQDAQDEIAEKRIGRADEKLEKLRSQLSNETTKKESVKA